MCIAYPARVLSFDSTDASIEMDGRRRRASMLLRPQIAVGDWVLVAAGTVLRRLDAEEAQQLLRTISAAVAATEARLPPGSSSAMATQHTHRSPGGLR
jgi:hydrogenase expression/formation protein HypC